MKLKDNFRVEMSAKLKLLSAASICCLSLFATVSTVYAEDLSISNNGSGSKNQVTVTSSNNQAVSQSNEAKVDNSVKSTQETGSNSTSSNTGGKNSINTGDTASRTEVKNSANAAVVKNDCCPNPNSTSVKIVGNGASSTSTAQVDSISSTTVSIDQSANITNSITNNSNTGKNTANANNSDVAIKTGNVSTSQKIVNEHVNTAEVTLPQGGNSDIEINIKNNGKSSVNQVLVNALTKSEVVIINSLALKNMLESAANTGQNSANSNLGTVTISTGDVLIDTFIKNADLNFSQVILKCCPPAPTVTPPPPPGGGSGGSGGESSGGGSSNSGNSSSNSSSSTSTSTTSVGGNSPAGVILAATTMPATGNFWLTFLTLLSALMFILGLYLRFHPGQDPGYKAAYV